MRELVKNETEERGLQPMRISTNALKALHEDTESFLSGIFRLVNRFSIHAGRVTITDDDVKLASEIIQKTPHMSQQSYI